MRRKTQLNVLILIGLIFVIVTAWVCGWNLLTHPENWNHLLWPAAVYAYFGWVWRDQFRKVTASGTSGAKWTLWTIFVLGIPLWAAAAAIFFVSRSVPPQSSSQELIGMLKGMWRSLLPIVASVVTALLIGVRIDASFPVSRILRRRGGELS